MYQQAKKRTNDFIILQFISTARFIAVKENVVIVIITVHK